jgi:Na+-driven multidrug efflux pump
VLRIRIASAALLFGSIVPLMLLMGMVGAGIATLMSSALALTLLIWATLRFVGAREARTTPLP